MTSSQVRWFAATAAALALGGAAAGSVRAQAPTSGDQVIRAMHDRYAGKWYKTLTFQQKTTRRTPADTMVIETWYETAEVPGRLRIDIAPRGGTSYIYANDSIYVTKKDSVLRRLAGRNPLLILGFDVYGQPADKTIDVLKEEGFDLGPVHEDTWEGRPVYVVGAAKGDTTSKQFWVDANDLLFVRSIAAGARGRTDVRFQRYERVKGGWIATEVLQLLNGRPALREQYANVQVDVKLDDAYFDPKQWATVRPGLLYGKP